MNMEIGTEAAQFTEKEYINGILVAVHLPTYFSLLFGLAYTVTEIGDTYVERRGTEINKNHRHV
jgi:hypothetical protein